jgi:ribosomal protein L37AE/L43A
MLDLSKKLLYYKRREIETRIVESCRDKEVGIRYGDNGYGKRPDILVYENDVLDSVKKGATSFHASEERWESPLQLSTEMKKHDLEELRKGWDLVLDIDCPYWFYSKLTAHLFIKSLRQHGIKSISCKFSGNKGFHIGVPFEAFPKEINNLMVKNLFPEGPKRIALYLLDYISNSMIEVKPDGEVNFDNLHITTIEAIAKETGKPKEEFSIKKCRSCKKILIKTITEVKMEFVCPKCSFHIVKTDGVKFLKCDRCNLLMDKFVHSKAICSCGSKEFKEYFDPVSIVDLDTVLISSRHMYRAPYSMHEKSGLASVPIDPETVLSFEKIMAEPERINPENNPIFLDPRETKEDEAKQLLVQAFDYNPQGEKTNLPQKHINFEEITDAIPVELFPPCMLKILEGLEDGKKRSLFVLTNFLTSVGWNHDQAEKILLDWNKKNKEPLKDAVISGQVNYHRTKKTKVLPPNCRSYYQDFKVCFPDSLCDKIKNPVQYSKRRSFALNKKKPERKVLSDEQKLMRKEYRQKLKKEKTIANV